MAKELKTKKSFGSVKVAKFSPTVSPDARKALNIKISFEEAMRLHLGIEQALHKLNSYDRTTKGGRRMGMNLCVYLHDKRITIIEEPITEKPVVPDDNS